MNEWNGEERREHPSHPPYCLLEHKQLPDRLVAIEAKCMEQKEHSKALCRKIARLTKWVYTGIGICLVAGLIASGLFMSIGDIRADVSQKMQEHERVVEAEETEMARQLESMAITNIELGKTVAVMGSQLEGLGKVLEQERQLQQRYLEDLKEVVMYHIRYHNNPPAYEPDVQ